MNIDGTEKNYQIDEAYLLLGKQDIMINVYSMMPSTISYTNTLTAVTFTKLKFGEKNKYAP
jgi:hypothetical protein